MKIVSNGHGHAQRGWQGTDEEIVYGFIRALRRGDYDRALDMAPTEARMADWPELKRREWRAWIELTHRMKGQRDHERSVRGRAGRRPRGW